VKRKELERKLRRAGCLLKREGASHSLWLNPRNGVMEAVPRHQEIKDLLARKILRALDAA
jgi:mRNA interferase HicA